MQQRLLHAGLRANVLEEICSFVARVVRFLRGSSDQDHEAHLEQRACEHEQQADRRELEEQPEPPPRRK
ncbi:hypothetical protein [Sorangium sp. So ce1151]|uniref:hypothetical protein n=1 Tax=Sorangium sp. So ce1151 TaxID=3133332 RepID=UPI003F641FED